MKRAASVWVLVAALCIGGGASRQEATSRRQSTAPRMDLASDFFPVMSWEIQPKKQVFLDQPGHGIESLRECGFNTVAFVRPDQLEKVEKAGMRAIVGRPGARVNWRAMSGKAIVAYVKKVVGAAGESDALIGYFLADEPGARDFPALGKAVAALKRLAPGKLAYINLYPNYATLGAPNLSQLGTKSYVRYLERYVAKVKPQFISYDNYGVTYSMDLKGRVRAAQYYRNLLQIRGVAKKHNLPFWSVVNSNQIRPHTTVPSPANLLIQAYTALSAGARGLTWFTYYAGRYGYAPIDKAGNRTATWSYLQMVNAQVKALAPILTRLRSTGVYFTAPPAKGLRRLPGRLIRSIKSPAPVMVGEFSGKGNEKFALVVNQSLKRSVKVIVKARTRPVRRVSPVDLSLTPLAKGGSLWLAAGQGMLLRL